MTANDLKLSIVFNGVGWATISFSCSEWSRTFDASYIAASPFDFLSALWDLEDDFDPQELTFNSEAPLTIVTIAWDENAQNNKSDFPSGNHDAPIEILIDQEIMTGKKMEPVRFSLPFTRFCRLYIQALDKEIARLGFYGMTQSWHQYGTDFPIGLYLKYKAIALGRVDFVENLLWNPDDTRCSSLVEELELIQERIP